jgi:hypothetical protein
LSTYWCAGRWQSIARVKSRYGAANALAAVVYAVFTVTVHTDGDAVVVARLDRRGDTESSGVSETKDKARADCRADEC